MSVPARPADGSTVPVEFTTATVEHANRVVNIVAVMRDVTARFEKMKAFARATGQSTLGLHWGGALQGNACKSLPSMFPIGPSEQPPLRR